MKFFNMLLITLILSFSTNQAIALQIEEQKEIFSQTTEKNLHSPIKAIIFDCDGTLVDNGISYFLEWQYAMRCQGYELDFDKFWNFMNKHKLVGTPGSENVVVKYCCELLGRNCVDEIMKDKKEITRKLQQTYEFPAIKATVDFLHTLGKEKQSLGLKIGLASGNSKENVLRVLKRLNIEKYFDVIVCGNDDLSSYNDPEGTNKPKPYIYLHACKLLGLHPEQCVAIEDSLTGLSSAVGAGCITVAIPNAYTAQQDFSSADLKVISLSNTHPIDFIEVISNLKRKELISNN